MKKKINPILFKFGQVLASARKRRGITQETVWARAGFMKNTVTDLERGKSNSQLLTLLKYAQAANISLAEVFSDFENVSLTKSKKIHEILNELSKQDEETLEILHKQMKLMIDALKK